MKFLITLEKFKDDKLITYNQTITDNYEVHPKTRTFFLDDNLFTLGGEFDVITVEYEIGGEVRKEVYNANND